MFIDNCRFMYMYIHDTVLYISFILAKIEFPQNWVIIKRIFQDFVLGTRVLVMKQGMLRSTFLVHGRVMSMGTEKDTSQQIFLWAKDFVRYSLYLYLYI
jgi:hypothetical protein